MLHNCTFQLALISIIKSCRGFVLMGSIKFNLTRLTKLENIIKSISAAEILLMILAEEALDLLTPPLQGSTNEKSLELPYLPRGSCRQDFANKAR